ncbi:hypothetical protein V2G26_002620 [Clonostachys chloroleuca]
MSASSADRPSRHVHAPTENDAGERVAFLRESSSTYTYTTFRDAESAIQKTKDPKHMKVSQFWSTFSVILVTVFVAQFDTMVVASSHPVITSSFNSSGAAPWLSTAFILMSTTFQPLIGRLSDCLGRKPPYVLSLLVFMLATAWCALAQSMLSFILARAVCGLGVGCVMILGSIMMGDLVSVDLRGQYQSYINGIAGFGSALGASTGGLLADVVGWRWSFGLQVPLLFGCLVLAWITIPNYIGKSESGHSISDAMKAIDYRGSMLLSADLMFLILGLNLGGNAFPWSHPFIISSLCIALLLTPIFLYNEVRHPQPIVPLSILVSSPRANLLLAKFTVAAIIAAISFNIPLYFRAVMLQSSSVTGLRLVIIYSASSVVSFLTGYVITFTRRIKWSLVIGSGSILLGAVWLGFGMSRNTAAIWQCAALLPLGIGQGLISPGLTVGILSVSPQDEQAVTIAMMSLWRSIGQMIGVVYSSLVLETSLARNLDAFVTGPSKETIIRNVKYSVDNVLKIPQPHQDQVIRAYDASLTLTFQTTLILAALTLISVVYIKLPRLQRK